METLPDPVELCHRRSDKIDVWLFWHRELNLLSIAIKDSKLDFEAGFIVPNDKGMEAFRHPYAYMPEEQTMAIPAPK